MAKTPHSPGDLQRMETHIFDEQARLILETYLEEEIDYDSNGNAQLIKRYQSVTLQCGCQWHLGLNGMRLAVCQWCREPRYAFPRRDEPRHGVICLDHAQQCCMCGMMLCPRHTHRRDNKAYCRRCLDRKRGREGLSWMGRRLLFATAARRPR